jgi:hypothetical protein
MGNRPVCDKFISHYQINLRREGRGGFNPKRRITRTVVLANKQIDFYRQVAGGDFIRKKLRKFKRQPFSHFFRFLYGVVIKRVKIPSGINIELVEWRNFNFWNFLHPRRKR